MKKSERYERTHDGNTLLPNGLQEGYIAIGYL